MRGTQTILSSRSLRQNNFACLLAGLMLLVSCLDLRAQTTIAVDGKQGGQMFYGAGAVSGGGGNSRLLYDYQEPYRTDILDYLFKPNVGANMQILKVEIGGGNNSTSGSEASHEYTQGQITCNAGFEWWMMAQAKQRNPNIKLYAAAWTAPAWVGGWFNGSNAKQYLLDWMQCAKKNGFTIDYLDPGPNEYNNTNHFGTSDWWIDFRQSLTAAGFGSTQILAGDWGDWQIADDLTADAAWKASVAAIGAHYPCGRHFGYETQCNGTNTFAAFPTSANALNLGLPLWQSEGGSEDFQSGAPDLIRSMVRGYTDASLQAFLNWPLIAAVYRTMAYDTTGVIWANQPWSGWYSVGASTWAMAHVTQFTQPGWSFIASASGYLNNNEQSGGAYMTLRNPASTDYSTILDTTTATAAQTVTFKVSNGLSTGQVQVWRTNLAAGPEAWFIRQASVTPDGSGSYTLTVQPNSIYTVSSLPAFNTSTNSGSGGKGSSTISAIPAQVPMHLPYVDSLTGYANNAMAAYLANDEGDFESVPCFAPNGHCIQQMVSQQASVLWPAGGLGNPVAMLGDPGWTDYSVSINVLLHQSGYAYLAGRVFQDWGSGGSLFNRNANSTFTGYFLQINESGQWALMKSTGGLAAPSSLQSGTLAAAPGLNAWINLKLAFKGTTITPTINGVALPAATDPDYRAGHIGIGVEGFYTDEFYGLDIEPLTGDTTPCPPPTQTAYTGTQVGGNLSWNSGTTATVATGDIVDFGPQGGSAAQPAVVWNWTKTQPASTFVAGSQNAVGEIDFVPLTAGTNAFVSNYISAAGCSASQTYTVTVNSCTPDAITPYLNTGTGWRNVSRITVPSGSSVELGPQPAGGTGTWSWSSSTGYTSTQRDITNIPLNAGVNTYTVIYKNPGGCSSTQTFVITVGAPSLANGTYTVKETAGTRFWDDYQGNATKGTLVDLYGATGSNNQKWTFTSLGNGYYKIVNVNSNLALNDPGVSMSPGTELVQWTYDNGSNNSIWQLIPTPSGIGYTIVNAASNLAVDEVVDPATQVPVLVQNTPTGGPSQVWLIQ